MDEKSQIQGLDRTQPGLPPKKGRCGTMTHDNKRNGTTTLFAALNLLEGSVIGRGMQRHTHQEFIRFLNAIENTVPKHKQVHVVLDNYRTQKHPKVVEWLGRYERFTFHFTPTSASWINAVEGFSAKLTNRRLKRGVFHSIVAHQAAVNRFVKEAKQNSKPFRWTKDPDEIIAAVRRGHQALYSHHERNQVARMNIQRDLIDDFGSAACKRHGLAQQGSGWGMDQTSAVLPNPVLRIPGAVSAPHAGLTFAAKDPFDMAGHPTESGIRVGREHLGCPCSMPWRYRPCWPPGRRW